MKHLPVELSESAISDIIDIMSFVFKKSASLDTALKFKNRIEKRCEKIGIVPYGGVNRSDLGENIQIVPFEKSAVILYTVHAAKVEVINVYYGGKDYDAIMRDDR